MEETIMKVIKKDINGIKEVNYPTRIDLPVQDLNKIKVKGRLKDNPNNFIEYYYINEIKPTNPNSDKYYIIKDKDVLLDEVHKEYAHLKVCNRVYKLVEKTKDTILEKLNTEFGIYVDEIYPIAIRIKHIIGPSKGSEKEKKIKNKQNWLLECQEERQRREDEYLNNDIFPDFYNYPILTIK